MKVFLYGDSYRYQTREGDGQQWGDRGETKTEWNFSHVSLEDRRRWLDSIEVGDDFSNDDLFYGIVVVYSTGDSFGHDDSYCAELVAVVRSLDEADGACNIIRNDTRNDEGELELPNGFIIPYVFWNGYFENLETIHVISSK